MQTRLPQVDKLLRHSDLENSLAQYRREIVVKVLRQTLDYLREKGLCPTSEEIVQMVAAKLDELARPSLKKVINGTGVVLNTNLGRSPISQIHLEKLKEIAFGYCNLELNLETGKRGKRSSRLEKLLNILTGAESSLAVNNNAAAVVLCVNCFALGKEVIVSRGELIEIGGSFRVPDVITAAGGKLREVGTTNKTRVSDFEKAIGPETGMVMRCHRSNFEIKGFTEEASIGDLVELCARKQIPFVEDLGSGVLMSLAELGLDEEPTLEESMEKGVDLVTFSGDKLLGGPQAGVIAGKKQYVERLAQHPLYRALRLDKISISLLEQTLCAYLLGKPQSILPALDLMSQDRTVLRERIEVFKKLAETRLKSIRLELIDTNSAIGGGSLPGKEKPSAGVVLQSPWKPSVVAQTLRQVNPPVITIAKDNDNIIDFRTVLKEEEELLLNSLCQLEDKLATPDVNRSGLGG